jgi:hypothetical protein
MSDLRTYYAPEVETALVSLVWRHPEYLEPVLRELDPETHFVQPHCRHILKAVQLVFTQLGATDWSSIVQALREQKLLEETGNLVLLDEVFTYDACGSLLNYYIDLLKDYAKQRKADPTQPVYRFTGGRIQLQTNPHWGDEGDPDYFGVGFVAGKKYNVKGWVSRPEDKSAELKLYPAK